MHPFFKLLLVILALVLPILLLVGLLLPQNKLITSYLRTDKEKKIEQVPIWNVRSIDTVKYSRDIAREKANDPTFTSEIENQVKNIAQTGATHIALGTPYDPEFIPFLRQWVVEARKNRLHVWFRGNLSGWEGWFEYKRLSKESHTIGIEQFILNNSDLFEDGDILTTCTECENGGQGDPRQTGDVFGFRAFLIEEHTRAQEAFKKINKKVATNYFSMNGDVAKLIMDKETTKSLDGIVVIDHYVKTKEQLNEDITALAESSGGSIVLGEWGAPIPDIHGTMTEAQQATWIAEAFELLERNPHLVGVNYWTNMGSSTEIWKDDYSAKRAVDVIKKYYTKTVERIIEY